MQKHRELPTDGRTGVRTASGCGGARAIRTAGRTLAAVLLWAAVGCGPAADPDGRAVAEWVLQQGGTLQVAQKQLPIAKVADLPEGDLTITHVDLSGTDIRDADLTKLFGLKSLRHLNLHRTKVTDAGLDHIAQLTTLEELELSFTEVSDQGIEKLVQMPKLRKLFLANTFCTPEGISNVQNRMKNCRITH